MNNVAVVHCLMDTSQDPSPTNKATEPWFAVHKPALEAMPELAAEYSDLAMADPPPDGRRHESTYSWSTGVISSSTVHTTVKLLRHNLTPFKVILLS
ncbi:hypothetical protein F5X99DRAFT_381178 [Biscogniauxia marginata]|nr:hypothetical protein F5X99DRAFT_381178 [Biscogniauxia marginata]